MKLRTIKLLLLITSIILAISCNDETNFGIDLIPDEDKLNFQIDDTTTLRAFTVKEDTVIISNNNELLIGNYTDTQFGPTEATVALQFNRPEGLIFTEDHVADSIFLELPFSGETYGIEGSVAEFEFYRLTEQFLYDSAYYNDKDPSLVHSSELLGTVSFNYSSTADTLKFKLDNSLAQEIMSTDTANLSTTLDFIKFFNGIYIKSKTVNSQILKFQLNSATQLKLYYHNSELSDSACFYSFDDLCAKLNFFERDYSSSPFYNSITDENNQQQDSVAYIQAMGGVKVKVEMPYFKEDTDSDLAIIRAELILFTEKDELTDELNYPAIDYLMLELIEEDGTTSVLPGSLSIYETSNKKEYHFDIADYIKDLKEGTKTNSGLYISAMNTVDYFGRSIITSGKHSNNIKLVISYGKKN